MRRLLGTAIAICAVFSGARPAGAQTAQRFSLQASSIYAALFGNAFDEIKNGIGAEGQGRFTVHSWSFGVGIQYTVHGTEGSLRSVIDNAQILGVFFEPRLTLNVGSSRFAPYVSSRLAFSKMAFHVDKDSVPSGLTVELTKPSGPTINVGGGVLIRLTSRMNFDLGVTYGYTKFGNIKGTVTDDASGFSLPIDEVKIGNGTNAVIRAGLAIGIK